MGGLPILGYQKSSAAHPTHTAGLRGNEYRNTQAFDHSANHQPIGGSVGAAADFWYPCMRPRHPRHHRCRSPRTCKRTNHEKL